MAKAYRLNRNGGTDTFTDINNDSKVKHYASDNAAEADIENLEVGQIISTPDEHNFSDLINQITTAEQNALDAIDAAESVSVATVTDEGTVQETRLSNYVNGTSVPLINRYIDNLMTSYGMPVGTLIEPYKNPVDNVPKGYLLADGRDTFGTDDQLSTKYPLLYSYLGNTNVLPCMTTEEPDWDNAVSASDAAQQTTDYTAPKDGIVNVTITGYNGAWGYVYVKRKGGDTFKVVSKISSHGSGWLNDSSVSIPVKKGDIVRRYMGYTGDYSWYRSFYFIPYKETYKYIKAVSGTEGSNVTFKTQLKDIVAESTDFADFKTRIGAW